ncbi:hypothetical protein pb186bvf_000145 [Paramecium bursaria]
MFKYLNEFQVPEKLRCVICLQICHIPIQCYHCLALHCYQCIIQNKNQCGRGCRQKIKKPTIKPKTFRNLQETRCQCNNCQEFISYKSYRKHTQFCDQANTESLKLNQRQDANFLTKNLKEQKRISKFKLRRIIFPCLHLFEQYCSRKKLRREIFEIQYLKEHEKLVSLLKIQISKNAREFTNGYFGFGFGLWKFDMKNIQQIIFYNYNLQEQKIKEPKNIRLQFKKYL